MIDSVARGSENPGVIELWKDLSSRIPSFTFDHGDGLGVLAVGYDAARMIQSLVGASEAETDKIRRFFASLGRMQSEHVAASTLRRGNGATAASDENARGANRAADFQPPRLPAEAGGGTEAAGDLRRKIVVSHLASSILSAMPGPGSPPRQHAFEN